jgi:hypothetical protein
VGLRDDTAVGLGSWYEFQGLRPLLAHPDDESFFAAGMGPWQSAIPCREEANHDGSDRTADALAVYTRKSTEHNLDLAFTSLDAQREAWGWERCWFACKWRRTASTTTASSSCAGTRPIDPGGCFRSTACET